MDTLRVLAVARSVLKGAQHRTEASIELTNAGVSGNRRHALVVDSRVLPTVQVPQLAACRSALIDGALQITLPNGQAAIQPGTGDERCLDYWGRTVRLRVAEGPVATLLSSYLGLPVRLGTAVEPRSLVYAEPVSLVTTGELEAAGVPIEQWGRVRANLLLEHRGQIGRGARVRLGDVELEIGEPIPRCRVIDANPETGQRDRDLFAELPTKTLGVGARVRHPGQLSPTGGAVEN